MKLTYQAPAYRHIALDGTTAASGCTIQAPHDSSSCAYKLGTVEIPIFGTGDRLVFTSTACNILPSDAVEAHYFGDADPSNVFGS